MRKELIGLAFLATLIATMGIASSAVYYVVYNTPVELGSQDDGIYADGFFHLLRIWDIAPGQALAVPNTCSKLIDTQWTDVENQTIDGEPIGFDGACVTFKIDEVQDMR